MRTLIKHGLIVDPASHVHSKNNLLVEDGRIQGLTAEEPEADVILYAEGMVVLWISTCTRILMTQRRGDCFPAL